MKNITLFLGAGASHQFDIPVTSEFKEELQNDKSINQPILKSFLNTDGFDDIEHVLTAMKEIRILMAPASNSPYAGKYFLGAKEVLPEIPDIKRTFKYLQKKIGESENRINARIFERYNLDSKYEPNLKSFYGSLLKLLTEDREDIHIGTTNYDYAIENFCDLSGQDYICDVGLPSNNRKPVWDSKKFSVNLEKLVYLYKIHGSLDWEWDGSNIIKSTNIPKFANGASDNLYIAPTLTPKPEVERPPYNIINNMFKEKLLDSEICLVIGYAFRDQHINSSFSEFLDTGKHLIMLSPNCKLNYSKNLLRRSSTDKGHVEWANQNTPQNVHYIQDSVELNNHLKIIDKISETLKKITSPSIAGKSVGSI